ncbi:MAG: ABC transporter permease [Desulfuromonadaceae bacterium]|nr:ABC transporter permease [Desulfuromonadaceae bacterium]
MLRALLLGFHKDLLSGVKNLRLHALRSLLTVLGMVFGVASVIAMLAVGRGAGQQALEQIRQFGSDVVVLNSTKDVAEEKSGQRRAFLNVYGITYADAARIHATMPHLVRVVPVKFRAEQAIAAQQRHEVRLVGTTPDWFALVPRSLVAGRYLSDLDQERGSRVTVITEQVARRLLPARAVLGEHIRVGGSSYTVVGVVRSSEGGSAGKAPDQAYDVYIPVTTFRRNVGDVRLQHVGGTTVREKVELQQILVQLEDETQVEPAAAVLEGLVERFHKKKDVEIYVPLALLRQAEQTQRTFNIVLGTIAGISLLVGGIGIMNIMLASVTERTREIGIRRAIGAKRHHILRQFLTETLVLSSCGGALGIGLGLLLPWLITRFSGLETLVSMSSLVLALLISMGVGIGFGLYPALRAARLDPIEALRHE